MPGCPSPRPRDRDTRLPTAGFGRKGQSRIPDVRSAARPRKTAALPRHSGNQRKDLRPMKILPIHTEALRYFGYTEEEAQFLYLVATHSGYFTCQQFLQFIKAKAGKRSVAFARKVVEKKHASAKEYHQGLTYLESEEQKLAFFCNQMGLDKKILPHKRYSGAIKDNYSDRYFVDKFPMFYNPATPLPAVPTFSFIDPGLESMDSFKTHLDAYLTLFTKLPELRFYYIATRDSNFERAKKLFMRTFDRLWNPEAPTGLFDYFRTRRTWDEKNYGKL